MEKSLMIPSADSDKTYDVLKSQTSISRELSIPQEILKPCVSQIMAEGLSKGFFPDRNTGAVIIASELRRVGRNSQQVADILKHWNLRNRPALSPSRIESAVKSAFKKEYKYSCNREELKAFCISKDFCSYAKGYSKHRKKFTNETFLELGWQMILNPIAKDIYYIAIPRLERIHNVGIGGRIYANYTKIAYWSGVSKRSIKKGLLELAKTPLLAECKIGESRKWERKATVIRRRIPIPKPEGEWMEKLEKKRKNLYGFR